MSKVTSIIDSLSHNARLMKELAGKGTAEKTEILIRETRGQIADEVLSKNASDAVRASVTHHIKNTSSVSAEEKETIMRNVASNVSEYFPGPTSLLDIIAYFQYPKHVKREKHLTKIYKKLNETVRKTFTPEQRLNMDIKTFEKLVNEAVENGVITKKEGKLIVQHRKLNYDY